MFGVPVDAVDAVDTVSSLWSELFVPFHAVRKKELVGNVFTDTNTEGFGVFVDAIDTVLFFSDNCLCGYIGISPSSAVRIILTQGLLLVENGQRIMGAGRVLLPVRTQQYLVLYCCS